MLLFIAGCTGGGDPLPEPNSAYMEVEVIEVKRNGIAQDITEQTEVFDLFLLPNDTIDISLQFNLRSFYENMQLDSIHWTININDPDNDDSNFSVMKNQLGETFTLHEAIADEPGNKELIKTYRFINTSPRLQSTETELVRSFLKYEVFASANPLLPEGTNTDPVISAYGYINLFSENDYINYQFRLYNNYVGKDPNDSTGVGFNPFKRTYCHELAELYYLYEDMPRDGCGSFTLVNLTYDTLYNTEQKIFIPSFGIGHTYRERNGGLYQGTSPLIDWERFHRISRSDWENVNDMNGVVTEDIKIGNEYKVDSYDRRNYYYLRIIDIVEDDINSYVEFDVYINKAETNY